ncbi:hypothetical protein MVEN_01094500 [Mycena venus]|uniref:Uncharacterized protein n=1 Tax=Mycena venus TaxID=2733690 RepID=A0A8H7CZW7_9AGAR|nr:hypothetical protein MVEN_01094500 [Mycena venus]
MTSILSPSNALPHSQRLRLIRSIRKLGDLITETSHLVDAPAHAQLQHTRSIPMASPSEILEDAGSQPLLTPSSSSPYDRDFFSFRLPKSLTGDRSPLSPTFILSLNSPLTPVVDPETLKERKLAKVVQTLGENVPPELVFPSPASGGKGRKRASTVSVPEYTSATDKRAVAMTAAAATVVGRRRHARERSRNATLKHAASSTSLRAGASPHPTEVEPFSYPSLVPVPVSAFEAARNSFPSESEAATPIEWEIVTEGNPGMRRKEAGWSGEWSGCVQNMEDVVRGLRELRLK